MKQVRAALTYIGLSILALLLMAPFIWMVLVSLHPSQSPIPSINAIIPKSPAWQNYLFVLFGSGLPVGRFLANSVVVTTGIVLCQTVVVSMAGFAFARLRFWCKEILFIAFLLSMMFAGPVTQIPVYLMLRTFGWLDTYLALIVPGVSSSFAVFLIRQFIMQIPVELDEAARIDGASDWQVYSRVIMPLSKTVLATAAAFAFIGAWTDFFWPLMATNSMHMRTLEVGLSFFKNSYGGTNWPLLMCAAVVVMTPVLLVFMLAQRYFVRGITLGGIK